MRISRGINVATATRSYKMGLFDKNKGLNESQRLTKAQMERKYKDEMEASEKRLRENLPGFQKEYNEMVREYGLIHVIRYQFNPVRGFFATIEIQDCFHEVEAVKKRDEEAKKQKEGGVVKD